jgi:predicted MPP superfamily phosphohydrolase
MSFFFIIFFVLYAAINFYIGLRGWESLEAYPYLRPFYLVFFIFMVSAYILAKVLQKHLPDIVYTILEGAGSFWFAFMLYFFIAILFIDIYRLTGVKYSDYEQVKVIAFSVVVLLTVATLVYGFFNTRNVHVKELNIKLSKYGVNKSSLNAVLVSDIHLSNMNNNSFARNITNKINALNPDIIFIAGDLVDDRASYLRKKGIGFAFKDLHAKYGVYGITGNHEYINGVEGCVEYMRELGINVLRDTAVNVNNSFLLVGREDRTMSTFDGQRRKELGVILEGQPKLPIILMDHTPFGLDDAINNNVDLQLSGHTHHGQLFPLNFVTSMIYEVSKGYHKRGNTQFYVSSGAGTWGPPIRTGSRSEIVHLKIDFTE